MPEPRAKKPSAAHASPLSRVRQICLALASVEEKVSHERPSFHVRNKTFVMYMDNHHGDGRLAIWCKATHEAQRMMVESDPERFFVPPYVGPRGWIGVRLEGRVDWDAVAAIVAEGYAMSAPKRGAAGVSAKPARAPARRKPVR